MRAEAFSGAKDGVRFARYDLVGVHLVPSYRARSRHGRYAAGPEPAHFARSGGDKGQIIMAPGAEGDVGFIFAGAPLKRINKMAQDSLSGSLAGACDQFELPPIAGRARYLIWNTHTHMPNENKMDSVCFFCPLSSCCVPSLFPATALIIIASILSASAADSEWLCST